MTIKVTRKLIITGAYNNRWFVRYYLPSNTGFGVYGKEKAFNDEAKAIEFYNTLIV